MPDLVRRAAVIAAVVAAAAVVVACGTPATASPPGGGSAVPSTSAGAAQGQSASPGASAEPLASGDVSSSPDGSPAGDPALEAMLPDSFQGVTFLRQSLRLADVSGATGDATPIEAIVAALGADPSRVSMAFAADPTQTSQVQFVAYRIPGTDAARLTSTLVDAGTSSGDTVRRVLLGGKQVVELVDPTAPDSVTCLFAKGDVLLGVVAPDETNAGKGLQRLP